MFRYFVIWYLDEVDGLGLVARPGDDVAALLGVHVHAVRQRQQLHAWQVRDHRKVPQKQQLPPHSQSASQPVSQSASQSASQPYTWMLPESATCGCVVGGRGIFLSGDCDWSMREVYSYRGTATDLLLDLSGVEILQAGGFEVFQREPQHGARLAANNGRVALLPCNPTVRTAPKLSSAQAP
eukprot:9479209-Pyramimonas_sp.AAC.1